MSPAQAVKLWLILMREAMGIADLFLDASGAGIPVDLVMDIPIFIIFFMDMRKEMKERGVSFMDLAKENKELIWGLIIELIPVVDVLPGFLVAHLGFSKSKEKKVKSNE